MGFGGGGTGSFALPNHDHTNALEDGGELLENTTLVDGSTMLAWLNSKNFITKAWTQLAHVDATGSSHEIDSGTITEMDFYYLLFYATGNSNSSASCTIRFNGDAANNYPCCYDRNGTITDKYASPANGIQGGASIGTGNEYVGWTIIDNSEQLEKKFYESKFSLQSAKMGGCVGYWNNTADRIDQITVTAVTSGRNWESGSFIKIWGWDK